MRPDLRWESPEDIFQHISTILEYFHVGWTIFAGRAPLATWLGALERGTSHLSPGTEIFENDLLVLILQHETCKPLDMKSGTNQMEEMIILLNKSLYNIT